MIHSLQLGGARRRALAGPITATIKPSPLQLVLWQDKGAMSNPNVSWSAGLVPPDGQIPAALVSRIAAAADQADAMFIWAQHYGLTWNLYRTLPDGTKQIVQTAMPLALPPAPTLTPVNVAAVVPAPSPTSPAPAIVVSAAFQPTTQTQPATGAPAAAAAAPAPSWFDSSTQIFGQQISNKLLAIGAALAAFFLFSGDSMPAPARRGRGRLA